MPNQAELSFKTFTSFEVFYLACLLSFSFISHFSYVLQASFSYLALCQHFKDQGCYLKF